MRQAKLEHWMSAFDSAMLILRLKPNLKMSEAEFKDRVVISIAKRYGWLVHHDLPAQNTRGRWMTNVQGDVGFPDLFMVHPFQGGRPL
jgi:hypothetical protein